MQDASIKLQIGANADQLKQVISDVENRLESLKNKISSLPDGAKGLNKLVREFNSLTKSAQNLESTLGNIGTKTQGTSKTFSPLTNSTKDAKNALTSLSLVAQDLPFGFIGIQNNLPKVIESFGNLTTSLKTSAISFKQLAPAIGFLGFSIVIAGITALIQKYGDLGTAVDVVFGKKITDSLKRAKEDFAKYTKELLTTKEISSQASSSQDGLIIKLQTLSGVVLDLSKSEKQRKNALDQLKALDKDRFENFDIEKSKLEGLKTAVEEYTNALIAQAIAKKFEDQVAESSIKLNQQRDAFEENLKIIDDLKREYPNIEQETADYNKRLAESARLAEKGIKTGYIAATKEVRKFNYALKEISASEKKQKEAFDIYTNLKTQFENATIAANDFFKKTDEGTKGTKKFKFEIEENIDLLSLQQKISLIEKLGTVVLDTKNSEKERIDALEQLARLEPEVWGNIQIHTISLKDLEASLRGVGRTYQELILQEKERVQSLDIVEERIRRQSFLNKQFTEDLRREVEERRKIEREAGINVPKTITPPTTIKINTEEITRQAGIATEALSQIEKDANFEKVYAALNNSFFNPVSDLFENFINTGEFAFEDFRKTVVNTMKKLTAQLIATGILKLLASILTGGGSTAAEGGIKVAKGAGSFAKELFGAFFGGGKVSAPSFGGVQSGGLNMGGQVNLTLRGSDLVGSLNRTNTIINRIG